MGDGALRATYRAAFSGEIPKNGNDVDPDAVYWLHLYELRIEFEVTSDPRGRLFRRRTSNPADAGVAALFCAYRRCVRLHCKRCSGKVNPRNRAHRVR
jgi:hypothetical protein